MYAQMDEKTGEALQISKAIPLPALNVRRRIELHFKAVLSTLLGMETLSAHEIICDCMIFLIFSISFSITADDFCIQLILLA